ncbi:hypothetical protein Tco_1308860 [Tanacetum coccineum]
MFSMTQDIGTRAALHIFNRIDVAIAKGVGFSITQDIGARAAIHIFNRISFAIAKGVGAQIVSRLPSNFLMDILVTNAAHRKRGKYMAKCAAIVYGFLPFSFSSLGELEADVVTLLKRIQKFSMAQDIGARATIHIFNRISFAIAKGINAALLALFEWLIEIALIRESVSKASVSNSPNVKKENGMNLYPLSSHMDVYFLFFFSTTLCKATPGAKEFAPVPAKGEMHVTSKHASLPWSQLNSKRSARRRSFPSSERKPIGAN